MFDALRSATYRQVVHSVYYALRLLKHRSRRPTSMSDLVVPGVESEPSPADQAMAWQAIQEIEAAEGRSIADLDQKVADRYGWELYEIMEQKRKVEFPPDLEAAQRTLDELRQINIHEVRSR